MGAFSGGLGEDVHVLGRLGPGVFQDAPLEGDVEEVPVAGPGTLLGDGDGNIVLLGIGDEGLAAVELPLPPRGDDGDGRVEVVVPQLEADLVVPLAGGAVGDGVGPLDGGDLHLPLGDEGSGDGGAEEVVPLVDGVGAEHGVDEVADELFLQVVDVDLVRAGGQRLFPDRIQFVTLPQVGGEGDHLAAVLVLQPLEDDGGVEPARIGEDYLLDFFLGH